ncbi:Pyrroline-5-carboxylate reductase [BD1-7 clade bacterium]|uniref:Pyrroline-5-carboxylate reductase n=1 Tax=BD1-7 clade bacterium TaxID=2029982 RepID=A0A5S9N5D8_9GAMM|nr:Pyrroline-5-carboxylate reductase [BD1-7 clade bacterium]
MNDTKIAFIGAGNMAQAIIGGLIEQGFGAGSIYAASPVQAELDHLSSTLGIQTSLNNSNIVSQADVVVLAVKPQQMAVVCDDIREAVIAHNPLIVSIAAGITCELLTQSLSESTAVVRSMPNTPALVQTGATGLFANTYVTDAQKALSEQLMNAIGIIEWIDDEQLMDAVTALSGSGPAYFFMVMEAMQAAGEKLGLPAETARNLTLQTALGAAKMANESEFDAAELRRRVTSPGGTTAAALGVFDDNDTQGLFAKALAAADERGRELAEQMK